MATRQDTALWIGIASVCLGIAGDILFYRAGIGLNVLIWTVCAAVVAAMALFRMKARASKSALLMLAPACLFAGGFAVFDSPGISCVNAVGLIVSLGLAACQLRQPDSDLTIGEALGGILRTWIGSIEQATTLMFKELPWNRLGGKVSTGNVQPVVRGALMATPVVIVIGGLLLAADPVFADLALRPFRFDPSELFIHGWLVALFGVLGAGLLRRALVADFRSTRVDLTKNTGELGPIEATVVLGAANLLFLAFVLVQIRYLFGSPDFVRHTLGLSYAGYARKGFFELLAVIALVLPVLVFMTTLARKAADGLRRAFKINAMVLVALMAVVSGSALYRMMMNIQANGLSELRVYPTAMIVWLLLVYVAFCATTLAGRPKRFAFASAVAGIVVCLGLNVYDPGLQIARSQVAKGNVTQAVDIGYLRELGVDTMPIVLRHYGELNPGNRRQVDEWLAETSLATTTDWRGYNASRARAKRLAAVNP